MLSDRDYMRPGQEGRYVHHPFAYRRESLVVPLIVVNVVVFILTNFGRNGLVDLLWLNPWALRRNFEIWRLGTYLFVHAGFWHIFWNMWGLYLFGKPVEARLGAGRFLRLYFLSGFIGGLCWLLFNWNARGGVMGASGAVFGVMMAAAIMFPNARIMLLFPPIPMRLKTFVAMYVAIEVIMELSGGQGRIAHIAHLGGVLGAFVYMRSLMGTVDRGPGFVRRWLARLGGARRSRDSRPSSSSPPTFDPDEDIESDSFRAEVDRILDKIGREGIQSLTPRERRILDEARERLRRRK